MTIGSIVGWTFLAAEEADEGSFNPILPTLPEIIWSALFFFALWALMKFVLLPPIQQGRDARRARVTAGQDSVSDSESELAQLKAAHEERIAAAKAEGAAIVDAARAEADQQRSEAVAQVEANIAQLRAGAQAEIDAARADALAGARDSVSDLARGAAGKVLGRSVDTGSSQSVIDSYLDNRGN
ncbi:MAG: F0F1 ATP synthase subunit B [Actinomycetota bacterium]